MVEEEVIRNRIEALRGEIKNLAALEDNPYAVIPIKLHRRAISELRWVLEEWKDD